MVVLQDELEDGVLDVAAFVVVGHLDEHPPPGKAKEGPLQIELFVDHVFGAQAQAQSQVGRQRHAESLETLLKHFFGIAGKIIEVHVGGQLHALHTHGLQATQGLIRVFRLLETVVHPWQDVAVHFRPRPQVGQRGGRFVQKAQQRHGSLSLSYSDL